MTAIALLNSEKEPHIIADTLLNTDGPDLSQKKTVWLPALGETCSEWTTDNKRWHITRLGRKTFILPNRSGLLAFSGECRDAFNFWCDLSADFLNRSNYEPTSNITRDNIDKLLLNNPRSHSFSLLGIVRDNDGNLSPLTHNKCKEIITDNFGKCYVSGTGASLLEVIIRRQDEFINSVGGWSDSIAISATEDLAEHISSQMLYSESDIGNGESADTSIAKYCGGFYEWYFINNDGVKPLKSRIDLHIILKADSMVITRLYYSEQCQKKPDNASSTFSGKYPLRIICFSSSFIEISYTSLLTKKLALTFNDAWGTQIDSTFDGYENNPDFVSRLSGIIDGNTADIMFGSPIEANRIRLIINDGKNVSIRAFINKHFSRIHFINDKITIEFSQEINDYILGKVDCSGNNL
ncbi:hypothetical protein NMC96_14135 [Citrobacter portucalensis]|uniref:hypothetical protein n=1 Tax=Citrobacter portucalensis TaxID=1639133 RepID=UPI00351CF51A